MSCVKPVVENGIALPLGGPGGSTQFILREAFLKMEPGDSFLWPENNLAYRAAAAVGIKVISRKQDNGGYRFWKLGKVGDVKNRPSRKRGVPISHIIGRKP